MASTDRAIALNDGGATISNNNALTLAGVISGSGTLAKSGAGTLTLLAANSQTNLTTVRNGVLQVGNGGTAGTVGAGPVVNNAILNFNRSDSITVANTISGPGVLNKLGAGTLTLGGSNGYAGGTTLNAGSISISDGNALGSGALQVNLTTGGTFLTIANTADVTLPINIVLPAPSSAQTFTLLKNSSGILTGTQINLTGTLSGGNPNTTLFLNSNTGSDNSTTYRFAGVNTFRATVDLNRGGIVVANASGLGDPANLIYLDGNNNTTLGDLRFETSMTLANPIQIVGGPISTGPNDVVLAGHLSGGALTKLGTGSLTLAADSLSTANVAVNAGTLLVNASLTNGGTVTVASGAVLGGSGTINKPVMISAGGILAPGAGIGTLTCNSNVTLSGLVFMELNTATAPTSDKLVCTASTLNYAGMLTVTNLGPALVGGESFDLFDAPGFAGSFGTLNLPALGSGLNWYTDDLTNSGSILVNRAPVGQDFSMGAAAGVPTAVQIIGGKFNPADADGNPLVVASVTAPAHGTSSTDGIGVTYTAAGNYTGTDSFNYVLIDAHGGYATNTVTVAVAAGGESYNKISGPALVSPGVYGITFAGIPGYQYALDVASDLTPEVLWTPLVTNTAATNGQLNFQFPAAGPSGYFRTRFVP
jgi:autotransporter-associated beta strand protein